MGHLSANAVDFSFVCATPNTENIDTASCSGTSIEDLQIEFSLSPNPTKGIFTIGLKGEARHGLLEVSVLDITGRELLRTFAQNESAISLMHLVNGVYTVVIGNQNGVLGMKRLIKN